MKKYTKFILIVFLISVGIGLVFSYTMRNKSEDISAQNISGNTTEVGSSMEDTVQTSSEEVKITQNTIVELEVKYQDCKHIETTEYEAPEDLVNLTQEELEEEYPEFIVKEFSEDKVCLYELKDGLCNEHFKITIDSDNMVTVYKLTSNYDIEPYQDTEISAEYLSEEDQKELEEGIYVYGTSNLNSTLESFE